MDRRLPRQARVRVRADFDRVFSEGRRTGTPLLALHLLRDNHPARLGLAVSRKVDRRAVGRNRIKRALREEFRALRAALPDAAFVVVARPAAATAPRTALRAAFLDALRRAGALPASGPGGTMPAASPVPDPTPCPSGE
ncbi:ribonuclease P protein component [Luteimonas granuli]|uniref:Ribonuclease P protein component n=1 Tax=Luteimonas granuli TaxID=1176533 RepID=A0A518N4B1_9GAMM|nr:ribonuclease P protein component [Luteimonas granuli]